MQKHSKRYNGLSPLASPGYLTNWAGRLFARIVDRKLKPLGISAGQIPVFIALANDGTMSQKSLALAAAIEQPTMAATLARMERDGFINRSPDPKDGRSAYVSLTPHALQRLEAIEAIVRDANLNALSGLTESERPKFLAMLLKVIASLERYSEEI
jgi:DNA-binding MarR family transcriptional regulator